jgi:cytochrome P450
LTTTSGSTTPLSAAEFDREELVFTLRDLFIGGDDTTATNLRWILIHLANQPDVQKRLQDEVDRVVGTNRLPSLDDEIKMPYTQAVILETFRRHTLLPLAMFHATTCDTEVGGCFVPANSTVGGVC